MFDKILIANRGEIACRIIKTAQRMGILTVAVYSDADCDALHVAMADEAVHIGPAPSRDSYLQMNRIIAAAKRTGAQAIHPGYGFLSENAEFCQRCADNHIIFIGPPVAAIEAMGSKSAAKTIMEKAQVPLVPGYHGEGQDPALLKQVADKMGYPVLLKAAAGGGGKGMREVWASEAFDEALAAAKRESLSAFNDDKMLVEKYLTQPRHIEIQVFFDQHGSAVYLAERDCSIQRRHQKIIEEAPAPGISEQLRQQMGAVAINAARAIDYQGAGTVEFLLDKDGAFYFMEMNTRLQVEHPVTEMITGQDLVEWQLRVAAGEKLPLQQSQIKINGHAFEARVYAEDPANDFLPVSGSLSYLATPAESEHVRIDTGVRQGDEISVYYDPMIAKLIVWDEHRNSALRRLAKALREYRINGLATNLPFLYQLSTCKPFVEAELDTGFIENNHAALFAASDSNDQAIMTQVPQAALYLLLRQQQRASDWASQSAAPDSPWNKSCDWRLNDTHIQQFTLCCNEQQFEVSTEQLTSDGQQCYRISFNGITVEAKGTISADVLTSVMDGYRSKVSIAKQGDSYSAYTQQSVFQFNLVNTAFDEHESSHGDNSLAAPMNGTIVALLVEVGDKVKQGDALLVMEAMKMEHTLRAPADSIVTEFYCQAGDLVDGGSELLRIETEQATQA